MRNSNKILIGLVAAIVVLIIVFAFVAKSMLERGAISPEESIRASEKYRTESFVFWAVGHDRSPNPQHMIT